MQGALGESDAHMAGDAGGDQGDAKDALLTCDPSTPEWTKAKQALEDKELAAPMCQPTAEVYAKLLIAYLMENELILAKFVWKRIPDQTKQAEPALQRIWNVGKALTRQEPKEVYEALEGEWPLHCQTYMLRLKELIRLRYLRLVGDAYSSICVKDLALYTGTTEQEALTLAESEKWGRDDQSGMVLPIRKEEKAADPPPSEEKLKQLTDYICFLEK